MINRILILSKFKSIKENTERFFVNGLYVSDEGNILSYSKSGSPIHLIQVSASQYDRINVTTPDKVFCYPLVANGLNDFGYPNMVIKL